MFGGMIVITYQIFFLFADWSSIIDELVLVLAGGVSVVDQLVSLTLIAEPWNPRSSKIENEEDYFKFDILDSFIIFKFYY